MEAFKKLMKNRSELLMLTVLVLYITLNVQTPDMLAKLVDNVLGNVVILLAALYLLTNTNPIVGVVALYAAYELIRRSDKSNLSSNFKKFLPTQEKKDGHFSAFNQFPVTLEEQMVKKMAPLVETSGPSNLNYKPNQEEVHNAMNV